MAIAILSEHMKKSLEIGAKHHKLMRAFMVQECRKYRQVMHYTSGEFSAGYEAKAKAKECAAFALHYHRMMNLDLGNLGIARLSEQHLPESQRRCYSVAVKPRKSK